MVRMNENRKGKVKSIFIHGRQRGQNSPVHLSRNFATLGPFPRLQPPCLTGPLLGSGAPLHIQAFQSSTVVMVSPKIERLGPISKNMKFLHLFLLILILQQLIMHSHGCFYFISHPRFVD